MDKFYGNYLGVCISRMDPEFRGRVKVFVPDVHPAMYSKWVGDGRDIKFDNVGDNLNNSLDSTMREKLERILPFAEAAGPVFGSSSHGFFDNATNAFVQTADLGQNSPTGNPDVNAISPSSSPLATKGAGIKPNNIMNGRLNTSDPQQLVPLGDYVDASAVAPSARFLNPYVEPKFKQLCEAYSAQKGKKLTITDCYRSLPEQQKCAESKGIYPQGLCARPGNSNHGLGLAVDVGGRDLREIEIWMYQNAGAYGFTTISKQGPGSREAWHWECTGSSLPPEALSYTGNNSNTQQNTLIDTAEPKFNT